MQDVINVFRKQLGIALPKQILRSDQPEIVQYNPPGIMMP